MTRQMDEASIIIIQATTSGGITSENTLEVSPFSVSLALNHHLYLKSGFILSDVMNHTMQYTSSWKNFQLQKLNSTRKLINECFKTGVNQLDVKNTFIRLNKNNSNMLSNNWKKFSFWFFIRIPTDTTNTNVGTTWNPLELQAREKNWKTSLVMYFTGELIATRNFLPANEQQYPLSISVKCRWCNLIINFEIIISRF